jgi:ABC-type polysaccharide/polyol phosphate export permease
MGELATLLAHRHLLSTMVRRDIGARFAGSSLGVLWALLNPAIMLGLYTLVFTYIYRVQKIEGEFGFTEFVFCGLWPWMAFQDACQRSVGAIVENSNLVKKLQFPSELLVFSVILSSFVTHGTGFLLFLTALMAWKGSLSLLSIALLPAPILLHIALAAGIGMILACCNVFFRDVGQLTTAGFSIWFFLSPVVYAPSLLPETLQPLLRWNPITPILTLYRSLILSHSFTVSVELAYCVVVTLILLFVGTRVFRRCRGFFADYL